MTNIGQQKSGRILFLDGAMGAAGDMLAAALYGLLNAEQQDTFCRSLLPLGEIGVEIRPEEHPSHGIIGQQMTVTVHGTEEEHHHAHGDHAHHHGHHHAHGHAAVADIFACIRSLTLPDRVKARAEAVYREIAAAEAAVHGCPVEEVHFHEVGALDAVADVTAACLALHLLAPENVIVSPLRTGFGQVRCAHGLLPIPAPATARLLAGIPCFAGELEGEFTTPTGAALIRSIATGFGQMPLLAPIAQSFGLGKRKCEQLNAVHAVLGQDISAQNDDSSRSEVSELLCNIDDMTGEDMAHAAEILLEAGALDICWLPAMMKKGRPGQILSCLCRPEEEERFARLILTHTTTFGLRSRRLCRWELEREIQTCTLPTGEAIRVKQGFGFGIEKYKPEYADLAAAAKATGKPIRELRLEMDALMQKKK